MLIICICNVCAFVSLFNCC